MAFVWLSCLAPTTDRHTSTQSIDRTIYYYDVRCTYIHNTHVSNDGTRYIVPHLPAYILVPCAHVRVCVRAMGPRTFNYSYNVVLHTTQDMFVTAYIYIPCTMYIVHHTREVETCDQPPPPHQPSTEPGTGRSIPVLQSVAVGGRTQRQLRSRPYGKVQGIQKVVTPIFWLVQVVTARATLVLSCGMSDERACRESGLAQPVFLSSVALRYIDVPCTIICTMYYYVPCTLYKVRCIR